MIEVSQLWVLAVAALCIGISKAGFSGVSLISVFLLAETFGAKASLGIALPMLVMADLIVYPVFSKFGSWGPVFKFLWPALVGIALAMWVLQLVDNSVMRRVIGVIILLMLSFQVMKRWSPRMFQKMTASRGFGIAAGVSGGLATMLANAAGPVMQLYLLTRNVPKMELIGIGARFFLVVNLLKLPLSAGLNLISWNSLIWNLAMLPAVALGVFWGKKLVLRVPQKAFEWLVVSFALLASLRLLLT